MKHLKLIISALFVFAIFASTNAQKEKKPITLGISVNKVDFYGTTDFRTQVDDALGNNDWNIFVPRITAEKYLKNGFSIQLGASINQIKTFRRIDDVDYLYWSVDPIVKYNLANLIGKEGWFDPYAYGGVSYVNQDSNSGALPNFGFGFNIWFNNKLGLNFHTGTKFNLFDFETNTHYQSSLGLVLKLAGSNDSDNDGIKDKDDACPEVAGLEEFNGCPDSDGDGIKDSDDACPKVAGSSLLNGCPDADGDGVSDKDDKCPKAKGTKANKGCPDTDGDGIIDAEDKCPSESGSATTGGCPESYTDNNNGSDKNDNTKKTTISPEDAFKILANSRKVLFNVGRSEIKGNYAKYLDEVATIMINNPEATFNLEGNTDTTGPDTLNERLSEDRAEAVKNYLTKKGVNPSRLSTIGNSDRKPVATNDTVEGRSLNRRTDIKSTN